MKKPPHKEMKFVLSILMLFCACVALASQRELALKQELYADLRQLSPETQIWNKRVLEQAALVKENNMQRNAAMTYTIILTITAVLLPAMICDRDSYGIPQCDDSDKFKARLLVLADVVCIAKTFFHLCRSLIRSFRLCSAEEKYNEVGRTDPAFIAIKQKYETNPEYRELVTKMIAKNEEIFVMKNFE